MSAKAEIGWRRVTLDGERWDVYARRVGREWHFFARQRRYAPWRSVARPPFDDWLQLLNAVERRVQRRLLAPAVLIELRERIRRLFPDAEV